MTYLLRRPLAIFGLLALVLFQAACVTMPPGLGGKQTLAAASLAPISTAFVRGVIKFTDDGQAIMITADASGLLPGVYTVHLQETETCATMSAHRADGMKTYDKNALGGLLIALTADVYGTARSETKLSGLTLEGKDSIVGRTVVMYAIAADGRPLRMACGQIGLI